MSLFEKPEGKKYHSRTIEVSSCEHDECRLIVKGCLTDHLSQNFHLATGEMKLPGSGPLHQMIIYLLVNKSTLEIEDIRVEMPAVPYPECLETRNVMESVKGLKITGGFTSKIKALAGSVKGCNHLVALLTAMGPAAVQGYGVCQQQQSPNITPDIFNMLIDNCRIWRKEGHLVNLVKERFQQKVKNQPTSNR